MHSDTALRLCHRYLYSVIIHVRPSVALHCSRTTTDSGVVSLEAVGLKTENLEKPVASLTRSRKTDSENPKLELLLEYGKKKVSQGGKSKLEPLLGY
jgi:hypothetical protein